MSWRTYIGLLGVLALLLGSVTGPARVEAAAAGLGVQTAAWVDADVEAARDEVAAPAALLWSAPAPRYAAHRFHADAWRDAVAAAVTPPYRKACALLL